MKKITQNSKWDNKKLPPRGHKTHYSSQYITRDYDVPHIKILSSNLTSRIHTIKNDFLKLKEFHVENLTDKEAIPFKYEKGDGVKYGSSIGLIIDYLGRFMTKYLKYKKRAKLKNYLNQSIKSQYAKNIQLWLEESFSISHEGFGKLYNSGYITYSIPNSKYFANKLQIIQHEFLKEPIITPTIIQTAFQIVRFDASKRCDYINTDWIQNRTIIDLEPIPEYLVKKIINIMNNYISFLSKIKQLRYNPPLIPSYRPFKYINFTIFISSADADFVDKNTLYELKCSTRNPLAIDILQVLSYFIMAKRVDKLWYSKLHSIAIVNLILNKIWTYDVTNLDNNIYREVEKNFLGFDFNPKVDKLWFDRDYNLISEWFDEGLKTFNKTSNLFENLQTYSKQTNKNKYNKL